MQEQLTELKLAHTLIPAVYGASLSQVEKAKLYDDRRANFFCCRSLTPAEIGCALSHLEAYRRVLEDDLPMALILEDDVRLSASLPLVLERLGSVLDPASNSVVLLSPAYGHYHTPVSAGLAHTTYPYAGGFYASSYVVTRLAAESLLRELTPVHDVADCWERLARHNVVSVLAVLPALAEQLQERFGSSTTDSISQQRVESVGWTIKYKAKRVRYILWDRLLRPLQHLYRALVLH
jgi:glycosyl transferase, family 25